jgi:hypothetical protein
MNLADNATVLADQAIEEVSHTNQIGSAVVDKFRNYLDHPVLVDHTQWTGATTHAEISPNLLALFLATAPSAMLAKYKNLMFFKAVIRIKVVVQGTAQAYGQMIYTFTPRQLNPSLGSEAQTLYNVKDQIFANAKVVPHIIIDPSKTATYEIDLPVCTPSGFYSFSPSFSYGSYSFNRLVFNSIKSGTDTAAAANVCTYMTLVNPEFGGLTSVEMTSSFNEEKTSLSGAAMAAVNAADAIGSAIPAVAPVTTLFSSVAGAAGSVLSFLGFTKPPTTDVPLVATNRTCDAYSQIDGKYQGIVLAGSQTTGVSISPEFGAGTLDDLEIAKIVAKPGVILLSQSISPASASGALVKTIRVSPSQGFFKSPTEREVCPLTGIALLHTAWRGDLKYTFEFVASVFHRATVLIAYDPFPNSTAPTLNDALATLQNVTVNISGNTVVEVVVPYTQPHPVLRVPDLFVDGSNPNNENGTLYLYVINPVVSNGSTDGVSYNVYLSSDNIRFYLPTPAPLSKYGIQMTSSLFVTVPKKVMFGEATKLDDTHLICMPDVSVSVKDIAKRANRFVDVAVNDAVTVFTYIQNYPQCASNRNSSVKQTFVGWLASAYLGTRGSLEYTYSPNGLAGAVSTDPAQDLTIGIHRASHHVHMGIGTPTSVTATAIADMAVEDSYAWTQPNLQVVSRVDVSAPMMLGWKFVSSRAFYGTFNNVVNFESDYYRNVRATYDIAVAAGDDMTFCWFLGFPILISSLS